MSVKTWVGVCVCVLAIFAGGFGAGGVVRGQTTQPTTLEELAGVKAGDRVRVFISGTWTDCTLVSRKDGLFRVSIAYPNWPDEIYPFELIKVNGKVVTSATELEAGGAIDVRWGSSWSPARVVEAAEGRATIRWDQKSNAAIGVHWAGIKPMEQGKPRMGQQPAAVAKPEEALKAQAPKEQAGEGKPGIKVDVSVGKRGRWDSDPVAPNAPVQAAEAVTTKPGEAADVSQIKVGHRVSAKIDGKWVEATVVAKDGGTFTVSPTVPGYADFTYPYGQIKQNGKLVTDPASLKPGDAVSVRFFGTAWDDARVVEINPERATIRWDRRKSKPVSVSQEEIKAVAQGAPKEGKVLEAEVDPNEVMEKERARAQAQRERREQEEAERIRAAMPKGTRLKLDSHVRFDETRMQFLTLTNEPAVGLKLEMGDGKPALTTDDNGEVEMKAIQQSAWFDMTCDGKRYRVIPNEDFYHGRGVKVVPVPVGNDTGVDVVKADFQVLLPDGKPAANVWVWMESINRMGRGGGGHEKWSWLRMLTDKEGKASFRMMPIDAMHLGQKNSVKEGEIGISAGPDGPAWLVTRFIRWTPSGKMVIGLERGQPRNLVITGRDGKAIGPEGLAGAKMWIQKPEGRWKERNAVAWTPGKPFEFVPGQYTLEVFGVERNFVIKAGDEVEDVQIDLKPAVMTRGRVETLDGKGAEGVAVALMDDFGIFCLGLERISDESWVALEKTKTQAGPVKPFELRQGKRPKGITPLGIAWTDASGAFVIESEFTGTPVVLGRDLMAYRSGERGMVRVNPNVLVTLYAIPSGRVTLSVDKPIILNQTNQVYLKLLYVDSGTPQVLREMEARNLGVPGDISPRQKVTLELPSGYAMKLVFSADKRVSEVPVSLKPGEALNLGEILLGKNTAPAAGVASDKPVTPVVNDSGGKTRPRLASGKTQTYKVTVTDKTTGKPITNAYLIRTGMGIGGEGAQLQAWEKLVKGPGVDQAGKPVRVGPSGEGGVCTLDADAGQARIMFGYLVYAEGYVPVLLDRMLSSARANVEGLIEIPVAMEPGARVRIVPEKAGAKGVSPYQQERTLYFSRLLPEAAAGKRGERVAAEAEPVVSYAISSGGDVVIVPRDKPLWCVAKDREWHDGHEGSISTGSAEMQWLSKSPVTPTAWEPVVNVPVTRVKTVAVNAKVEGPKGPLAQVIVYAAIDGSNTRPVGGVTDEKGEARFYLPVGVKLKFWVSRVDWSATASEPGWVVTLTDKPEPVVLKIGEGKGF